MDKDDPPAVALGVPWLARPDTQKAPHDVTCRASTARPDAARTVVHASPQTAALGHGGRPNLIDLNAEGVGGSLHLRIPRVSAAPVALKDYQGFQVVRIDY